MNYESLPSDIRVLIEQGQVDTVMFREKCYAYFKKIPNSLVTNREEFEAWIDKVIPAKPAPTSLRVDGWAAKADKIHALGQRGFFVIGDNVYDVPDDVELDIPVRISRRVSTQVIRHDYESADTSISITAGELITNGVIDTDAVVDHLDYDDLDYGISDSEYSDDGETDTNYDSPAIEDEDIESAIAEFLVGTLNQFTQEGFPL